MTLQYTPKKYKCICCGKERPETEFYREAYTNKRLNQCKYCTNVKRRVQRDKAKHGKFISKEKIRGMETPDYAFKDWIDVMVHFQGSCAFCGKAEGKAKKDKLDRDHVVAISKGGKTERKNIIPACRKCNRGRGNKDWREWFKEQSFYDPVMEARIDEWISKNM